MSAATGHDTESQPSTSSSVKMAQPCRQPALDLSLDEEQHNLARWAQESIKEGNLKHIIDSGIRDQISPKSLKEFVRIAGRCLHNKQKERPTMAEVLFSLESLMTIQQKMNSPLQPSHRTILGRMVDKLTFTSNIENSGKRIFGRTAVSVTERSYPCLNQVLSLLPLSGWIPCQVKGHQSFGRKLNCFPDHLHKFGTHLSWLQRLKICIGAARGRMQNNDLWNTGMVDNKRADPQRKDKNAILRYFKLSY
ncbi:unnamed protein product [Lactuca virosa]|uniref:Uncharacterized protein n=1 Tax=Lactuca virosa TaxID=75947 RepID=A0AAU9PHR4_9ASTR|nr:unnamed protein product [Lactuca virosa]